MTDKPLTPTEAAVLDAGGMPEPPPGVDVKLTQVPEGCNIIWYGKVAGVEYRIVAYDDDPVAYPYAETLHRAEWRVTHHTMQLLIFREAVRYWDSIGTFNPLT